METPVSIGELYSKYLVWFILLAIMAYFCMNF